MDTLEIESGAGVARSMVQADGDLRSVRRWEYTRFLAAISLVVVIVGAFSFLPSVDQQKNKPSGHDAPMLHQEDAQCAELSNKGSYFSVGVGVGTPRQLFDVVIDTGSNSVLVPSCVCTEADNCHSSACFRGTNTSSTFSITTNGQGHALMLEMVFGSGTLKNVLATDVVQVGSTSVMMPDGLLLVIDSRKLNLRNFDGILGMGIPRRQASSQQSGNTMVYESQLFMEVAQVSRFSICFAGGRNGALRFDPPPFENPLGSVSRKHWTLNFHGFSVGAAPAQRPTLECPTTAGNATSAGCEMIPDSGTTFLLGPHADVRALYDILCLSWSRCRNDLATNTRMSPESAFRAVLRNCSAWLQEDEEEYLPSIHLFAAGHDGREQILSLSSSSFIFMVLIRDGQGGIERVCEAAIGTTDGMPSSGEDYAPSWIMGMPLFLQYTVGHDMTTEPPSVSFDPEPCQQCGAESLTFAMGEAKQHRISRQVTGPPRFPTRWTQPSTASVLSQ